MLIIGNFPRKSPFFSGKYFFAGLKYVIDRLALHLCMLRRFLF